MMNMENFFVADSYKNMNVIKGPYENTKGKMVVDVKAKCDRCSGRGIIVARVENGRPIPIPVDGGVCYKCGGSGTIRKTIRAYTEKEYNSLQRAKERAAQKRKEAAAAKEKELLDNAEKYKHEVALKLGFGEDEKIYLVYGDDTYAIKDELKEMGARFDPTFKWFFSSKVELPEGYKLCEIGFDEIYTYVPASKWAYFKEDAKSIVVRRLAELKGPSTSIYYPGSEKERIRNITAKVDSIRGFEGMYGYTNVYTFTSGDYVFVWMTAKCDLDLSIGEIVDLTGTIKKFDEYLGVKQTHLTRCIIKKVGE